MKDPAPMSFWGDVAAIGAELVEKQKQQDSGKRRTSTGTILYLVRKNGL